MRSVLTAAMLTVVTLMLGATLVLTCGESSTVSPSFNIPSPDRGSVFSVPTSIYPDKQPTPHPLRPGVHQTDPSSFNTYSRDPNSVFSNPTPITIWLGNPFYLNKLPTPPPPLLAGVYQTYPWTIIIVVPGRGIDDRIIVELTNTNSKMPIIKPHLEVVPLSPAKP
jgi:hypothetical protein